MAVIGKRLKFLRHLKGWTQKEISEQMGIALSLYQRYEHDQVMPKADVVAKFSIVYGISADYILGTVPLPLPLYR